MGAGAQHRLRHLQKGLAKMAEVTYPNGKKTWVKNLGWLIKRIAVYHVRSISVYTDQWGGADLFVHFQDGTDYTTTFASATVLADWLNARKNLQGVMLFWDFKVSKIGESNNG